MVINISYGTFIVSDLRSVHQDAHVHVIFSYRGFYHEEEQSLTVFLVDHVDWLLERLSASLNRCQLETLYVLGQKVMEVLELLLGIQTIIHGYLRVLIHMFHPTFPKIP